MIFNHEDDFSIQVAPENEVEMMAKRVPILMPTTAAYSPKEWCQLRFVLPETAESLSIDLSPKIANELANKITSGEYLDWRDQALDAHEEEFSFLVMYRSLGSVELTGRGVVQQMLELGVEKNGDFAIRIFKSEPGEVEFTKFLSVLYPDWELGNLGRQLQFVASLISEKGV